MSIYSDINFDLIKQQNGDITEDIEYDAIKNSIKNIVLTMIGSRRMNPLFASNLYKLLFEPMLKETANSIGNEIFISLKTWEPRIIIKNINVHMDYDNNLYKLTIVYSIKELNEQFNSIDLIIYRN